MSSGYSVVDYGRMVEDKVRMNAYREAMRRHIKPGAVVVEIGSGPGITTMLACQLGASRVYAIETDPSIEIGRQLAMENGFADRIVFLRKMSTEVSLPTPADVLISDLRGQLPLLSHHIGSIRDARRRLLRPGGVQLPLRDRLFVGLSRDDKQYERLTRPWDENDFGLKLDSARKYAINCREGADEQTTISLGAGREWACIEYTTVESPNVVGSAEFELPEGEVVNGLEVWFEAEVSEGIRYSTAPDQPRQVYGRAWLPLERPVIGAAGDRLVVNLALNFVSGDYVTRWSTEVFAAGSTTPRLRFKQSTFDALVLSAAEMRRLAPSYVPVPNGKTRLARFVLDQLNGSRTVGAIANEVLAAFPGEFRAAGDAMELVRDLARRHCSDS
ncbi:MAG: 50S ribosomal protein L11 methyltransferase [Pseudomarimonas sp.]